MKPGLLAFVVVVFTSIQALADWPRTFQQDGATFTVYQPQVTGWDGNTLTAKMAVSVQAQGAASPTFGTISLSAPAMVDRASDTVDLGTVAVASAVFPGAPGEAAQFGSAVAGQVQSWGTSLSLKAIEASLAVTNAESARGRTVPVLNTVPQILFSETPAVLVLVDGDPALRPVAGTNLLRVINTKALLAMDQSSGTYYLRVNGAWASASAIAGPWTPAQTAPDALATLLAQVSTDKGVELFDPPQDSPVPPMPAVYVSTIPAELITTQGPPQFQPIPGTQLLSVINSGSSLFMNVQNQLYYVVISGRWFSAQAFSGPWQFVPANQLPPDFANIPESHPAGRVLASVSRTPQSGEAAVSSRIPQTAKISRTATTQVSYAGDPQFASIDGTNLSYAKNTATPVIKVSDSLYMAVVNGVWFSAPSPQGPWTVADSVPPEIYSIPPSSPVYYATNVYVYNSDPDYVVAGYTPGYFGACLAPEGVVVYGTGYYYPPFIGPDVWIGPPLTYGFGAGFACGLATGFAFGLAFDHGWGCGPWWGPWHGGWGVNNVNINRNWNNINVNNNNVYNRWGKNVNVSGNTINNINNNRFNNWKDNHPNASNNFNNWKDNHPDASKDLDNIRNERGDDRGVRDAGRIDQARNDALRDGSLRNDANRDDGLRRDDQSGGFDRDSLRRDSSSHLGDNNVFAGDDGHAWKPRDDGGWDRFDGGGWKSAGGGSFHGMDNESFGRSMGGFRSGGFGGFHGGGFRR